jgi:hypothetical protein
MRLRQGRAGFGTDVLGRRGKWQDEKKPKPKFGLFEFGAGDESRTRDLNLGKVALYQLSYSRIFTALPTCDQHYWRRKPESNRPRRICNPLHNHSAIAPWSIKKGSLGFP